MVHIDAHTCDLQLGAVLDVGGENVTLVGFGSLIFDTPLQQAHAIGTKVTVLDPGTATQHIEASVPAAQTSEPEWADNGFPAWIFICIIVGSILAVLLVVYCCYRRRSQPVADEKGEQLSSDPLDPTGREPLNPTGRAPSISVFRSQTAGRIDPMAPKGPDAAAQGSKAPAALGGFFKPSFGIRLPGSSASTSGNEPAATSSDAPVATSSDAPAAPRAAFPGFSLFASSASGATPETSGTKNAGAAARAKKANFFARATESMTRPLSTADSAAAVDDCSLAPLSVPAAGSSSSGAVPASAPPMEPPSPSCANAAAGAQAVDKSSGPRGSLSSANKLYSASDGRDAVDHSVKAGVDPKDAYSFEDNLLRKYKNYSWSARADPAAAGAPGKPPRPIAPLPWAGPQRTRDPDGDKRAEDGSLTTSLLRSFSLGGSRASPSPAGAAPRAAPGAAPHAAPDTGTSDHDRPRSEEDVLGAPSPAKSNTADGTATRGRQIKPEVRYAPAPAPLGAARKPTAPLRSQQAGDADQEGMPGASLSASLPGPLLVPPSPQVAPSPSADVPAKLVSPGPGSALCGTSEARFEEQLKANQEHAKNRSSGYNGAADSGRRGATAPPKGEMAKSPFEPLPSDAVGESQYRLPDGRKLFERLDPDGIAKLKSTPAAVARLQQAESEPGFQDSYSEEGSVRGGAPGGATDGGDGGAGVGIGAAPQPRIRVAEPDQPVLRREPTMRVQLCGDAVPISSPNVEYSL